MVDKFINLIVGYFIFGGARDTAMGIETGIKHILVSESYGYKKKPTKRRRRIM